MPADTTRHKTLEQKIITAIPPGLYRTGTGSAPGRADGGELFAALYGHIGREPIPERLRLAALLAPNQERVSALAKLA